MAFDLRVDGRLTAATVNLARGLAADAAGSVFVADTFNNAIRVVRGGGAAVTEEAVLSMLAGSASRATQAAAAAASNLPLDTSLSHWPDIDSRARVLAWGSWSNNLTWLPA
jgi:hypothetical protein